MPINDLLPSPPEERRIRELVAALRTPLEIWINPESTLVSGLFAEEFQSRLLAQHKFLGSIMAQASFDAAFMDSSRVAGSSVSTAPAGQRFWDVEIDGRKISLKSSQAKGLNRNTLHISKLTEAAWLQDCRTARMRRDNVRALFSEYVATVSSIIQLRFFQDTATYELVEIPVSLLGQILDLGISEFQSENTTINIPVGRLPRDFTLKLDRSDAKITLANIAKSRCIVHGTWRIPREAEGIPR